jgi:aspartate/methionine/tyrosine aminotransferase
MRIGAGWVSTVLQRVLLRLWQDREAAAQITAAGADYDRRRRALREALAARGVRARGATGINIWVDVENETRMVAGLRDAGYAVAPGSLFRMEAPPGVRLTVSPIDDDAIESLADEVAAAAHPTAATTPSR